MTGSSPATRRSRDWSSPSRPRISEFLGENRHTELSHQDALAAAQAEHERVRQSAIRVFKTHELKEECRRLQQQEAIVLQHQRSEEERIRHEERLRAEEERLRALKLKTVPKLPPEVPPPVPEPSSASSPSLNAARTSNPATAIGGASNSDSIPPGERETPNLPPKPPSNGSILSVNGIKPVQPASPPPPQQEQHVVPAKSTPFAIPAAVAPVAAPQTSQQQQSLSASSIPTPPVDRYVVIHQNLKKLRASLAEQAKSFPQLKARMGDMRRELRKSLGQMVTEKGGNKKQTATIQTLLQESLNGSIPSAMVDPSQYVTDQREPMDGALRNEAQLPSLFLYLLNIFAKTIINQFINECSAQPKAADPLGVITAQIFSNKIYLWRGKTLIDILMAKFRVVCPVLFGYRGSESTEQGRLRLGWRKDGGGWTPEQQHIDKMKGLAVGYAAIALRDFSKSSNTNPWPPSRYWTSLAGIVNTPPAEISNTQCVVLRSMIELYEERFITFYGSAAIAALRTALVDFPNKAQIKTPGLSGLPVLAQILKRDIGLEL